jgi:hypothetical protein
MKRKKGGRQEEKGSEEGRNGGRNLALLVFRLAKKGVAW